MALSQSELIRLLESLRSTDGIELVRAIAERMVQELIEAEASAHIGAEWNEHTPTRTNIRNGHREKVLTTLAGDLDLEIPKVRTGSFFPSLLERRRRIDQALYAVIMEAYVHGVSTRSVDDLVKALGGDSGISKSEVSRICAALDEPLTAFRTRPLDHVRFPYVYLDATYCKARVNHQIVSRAVVVATGITEDGNREVLGLMVGDSESEAFWKEFLCSLRERGLSGVRLVVTDQHAGLVAAVRKVMLGAAWQRCRVHFLRNVFSVIDRDSGEMVAATIRTIFTQPTAGLVRTQLDTVADMLGAQFPQGQSHAVGSEGGSDRVRGLPTPALEEDPVHEPAGTGEPRDQAQDRRRPGLPQRRRAHPAGHRRALRDARRMDRLPPPLPPRRQHERDLPRTPRKRPRATQHPEHAHQLIPNTTTRDTTRRDEQRLPAMPHGGGSGRPAGRRLSDSTGSARDHCPGGRGPVPPRARKRRRAGRASGATERRRCSRRFRVRSNCCNAGR